MTSFSSGRAANPTAPAADVFAITPSDAADLDRPTRALYVGTGGDLAIITVSGGEAVLVGVPGGSVLPLRIARIRATGTTAGALVGLI